MSCCSSTTPGGLRTVELYRHGRSTAGNQVLRGYQVSGYSSSRQSTGWKLFQVDKLLRSVHCQV